jgi:hypothetical protein
MWQAWKSSREDLGRWQAVEAAQLAAFALARLLNRDDGAERLEHFLASPEAQEGSGAVTDVDMAELLEEDPRLTYRAGELLDTDVLMVLSTGMSKAKRATARREAAVAIVWFLGFYNLLDSIARGRLPFQRIERLGFRVDDALLPLDQVQALDRYLDALSPELSMGQFEKLMRHRIRTLDPLPPDPEAPRRNRKVQLERCDDDSGILTLTGPIDVLDALYQRTRATARAISRSTVSPWRPGRSTGCGSTNGPSPTSCSTCWPGRARRLSCGRGGLSTASMRRCSTVRSSAALPAAVPAPMVVRVSVARVAVRSSTFSAPPMVCGCGSRPRST